MQLPNVSRDAFAFGERHRAVSTFSLRFVTFVDVYSNSDIINCSCRVSFYLLWWGGLSSFWVFVLGRDAPSPIWGARGITTRRIDVCKNLIPLIFSLV